MNRIGRRALLAFLAAGACLPFVPLTAAAPADRLAALARDVDRVESVRAVKRLQNAWAHYVDQGEWDRAAALFTADAEMAHGDRHMAGRAAILAYFRSAIGQGRDGLPARTLHTPFLMMPVITLSADGNSAKGRWRAMSMRGAFGGDAAWSAGIFENDYVRERGVWRIARQIFHPFLAGPYDGGWRATGDTVPMVPYRFQPADIGRPIPLGSDVPAPHSPASLRSLAGRIQALRDEDAVRDLQNAYGYYVDRKMWDDVVDLFAPTGRVEIADIGSYRGPAGIRRSFERSGPAGLREGEMNDHVQGDLIVEVAADGRHARTRAIQLGMIGLDNAKAWWTITRLDTSFVKQGGVWRIDVMRKAMGMMTDYAKGWAKDWSTVKGAPAAFQPDAPAPAALPPLWPLERPAPAPRPATLAIPAAEAQLHAAAAFDTVENLAGGYGTYLDDNHWEELSQLFAAQGERDSAGGGFIRTPARIAAFSRQRYGPYNPARTGGNLHMRTQPVIHVAPDGRTAQLRTRLFQMSITPKGSDKLPMFTTGMYEDDVVFEDGAWRIKRADIDHLLYAPYATGWTQIPEGFGARMTPPLTSVKEWTFDAPSAGDLHPSFPKLPHMWFHYANPVSGRKPPYLMPKHPLAD